MSERTFCVCGLELWWSDQHGWLHYQGHNACKHATPKNTPEAGRDA